MREAEPAATAMGQKPNCRNATSFERYGGEQCPVGLMGFGPMAQTLGN